MKFRVTTSLGQDTIEPDILDDRATALRRCAPDGAQVVVDIVKAVVQLVVPVDADDALAAVELATQTTARALTLAQLDAPASILTIEAEAVTGHADDLPPHPAP